MSYSIDDPFVYFSGDTMALRAAFVELVTRKLLQENGYNHSLFKTEFTPGEAYGYAELFDALNYMRVVLEFMGYSLKAPGQDDYDNLINDGKSFEVEIDLPELDGFKRKHLKRHKKGWEETLTKSLFYGMPCDVEITRVRGKKTALTLTFNEDAQFEWMGIADLIYNFFQLRSQIKEVYSNHDRRTDTRRLGSDYPLSA